MSNKKRAEEFTPGPWLAKVEEIPSVDGSYYIYSDKEFYIAETIGGLAHGVEEANANLIAAAPELYEALKEAVRISDRKTDAWERAKAALAKARGETGI